MSEDVKKLIKEQLGKTKIESPNFDVEQKQEQLEQTQEQKQDKAEKQVDEILTPQQTTATIHPLQKETDFAEIGNILEKDLEDIYFNLSPEKQAEFKNKGEETAKKISLALQKTKIKVNQIISLIKDWLKIIPGINKFFLEQEAKIKADEIIKMKK